jgi:hypothetical protein
MWLSSSLWPSAVATATAETFFAVDRPSPNLLEFA